MYQAPEIVHLQRAVDAVKRGLLPEKSTEPEPESDTEIEELPPKERPQQP